MKFLLLLMAVSITSLVSGQTLPYLETFDGTTIPSGWTQGEEPSHVSSLEWQFGTDGSTGWVWDISPALTGNYAILNNAAQPSGERSDYKNLNLISPNFTLSNVDIVNVQFNHFFYWENDAQAIISYSIDGGSTWVPISTLNSISTNPALYNKSIEGLTGETQIQFKLNYTGTLNYGWAIDDFSVTEANALLWTGTIDSEWNNTGNWVPNAIPGANTNVSIPNAVTNYPVISVAAASCYKLVMFPNATLTIGPLGELTVYDELTPENLVIESNGNTSAGSLIAQGGQGIGTVQVERHINLSDNWYLVSSPVNQSLNDFLSNNALIKEKPDLVTRAMMDFNTTTDDWSTFFVNNQAGSLINGKGYSIQTDQPGIVNFSGTITAGNVAIGLSRDNHRWNLVGNPYTSAINLNRSALNRSTFLRTNMDILEDAYVAVYAWVGGTYVAVNLASSDWNASIGQGFFVKAKTGSTGDLTFTPDMQVHDTGVTLKSGTIIPEIQLQVSNSEKTTSTQIKFIEKMTTGLDVGYDAGILKADPDFAVFTRLVNDNNIEFMLQCLPMPSKEAMVIPVGIDFRTGGEITFSAKMLNLPEESSVVLEDRLLEKFTAFDNSNSEYKATVAANAESTGRFYLHVAGKSQVTAIDREANLKTVNAWMERNEIVISGTTGDNAVVRLFDIQGRSVLTRNLERKSVNRINASGINPGIYMLQVIENGKRTGIKLSISGN